VVFRDLVSRDSPLPWRELCGVYRRMEARGELRGGRFVAGFVGEQFALPEAVESLRALRRAEAVGEERVIAATDPLNLVGQVTPGPRVPAVGGNLILLRDGLPIASREAGQLVVRAPLDEPARHAAARTLKVSARALAAS
jgi:ATP-dependent Lhr-like helicase